ncbi:uncharacterized protein LOC127838336 isoform X1 [Dreissena polymorpha]|uniref:Uncharacterized protein n=1 Tax=Dreissena polymorpha TaxID=45954 RepID=A0A9D4FEW8_DREPO|nr:uncharacterized protein LOC127838336 isoform X1 [Dreissena polymorpha]KAH3797037.1 hypothetical protein DPMN_150612 [Dreissena polymorpha]
MLDFLFRFSVLNTAFTVIATEIKEFITKHVGTLGGKWFQVFSAWVLYLLVVENWTSKHTCGMPCIAFLVATSYVTVVPVVCSKVPKLSILQLKFVMKTGELIQLLSFVVLLFCHTWKPVNRVLVMGIDYIPFVGTYGWIVYWISNLLTLAGLGLIFMKCHNNVSSQQPKPAPKPAVRQRPPSARIQARQNAE